MIDLFEHNREAYESAVAMLADTGKAAIVHPTGTGKSFIGFKLCEDNPEAVICWLSPSEYIFNTQLENIKAASGYEPQNVAFYTYAKLMLMSEAEIAEIKPDYIILDEFHRCGAEMWGKGVESLLKAFPNAPILGLSATAIRYLDNQRDMADELFDGNIASEMTLGEAIVRGILNPPKYVLSVYSYQKDLEHYGRRVKSAKNKAVRDAGERYLEAIRRAIEKADGLDVIFDKHMTDRTGKYIVFCANKEHMDEMKAHADEWFAKIDKKPHIYTLYTEDPAASKSFKDFKEDNDNTHLRLLYAIDALNEGVHVEDVSGVILLRPTVSPIIYKQQIGRALSASKKKEPIIFDIVNNIENLYSIGTIEEEMRAAIPYYLSLGEGMTVTERFTIIDEVMSCRELFEQLDDTLSASWDMMYEKAKAYYAQNGNLDVPNRYKTEEGYSLGSWVQTQRKVRAGEQFGYLDNNRIARLDEIGMRWESAVDLSWQRFYDAAKQYYEQNGDLNVKAVYVTDDGVRLGQWISNIRTYKKSGIKSNYLTAERIAMLDDIGMIWNQPDYIFERNFAALAEYHKKFGDAHVPSEYITEDGLRLGSWLFALKTKRRKGTSVLTESQIARLDELGVEWDTKVSLAWERGVAECKRFIAQNGHFNVHCEYITTEGYQLGKWLTTQRASYRKGKLSKARIAELEALGIVWNKSRANSWDACYEHLCKFKQEHGHINVPPDYKADGVWLNKWLNEQKQIYLGKRKGKSLTDEQIQKLEALGMSWGSQADYAWNAKFEELCELYEKNGDICVPAKSTLSNWLVVQRKKYREGKLTEEQVNKLIRIGVST